MKLLYTNENRYLVDNIHNIVVNAGIDTMLKNEFTAGGAGDLVPHETWLELWVINDDDYESAMHIINTSFSQDGDVNWFCSHCQESNDTSFDFCWNCQTPSPKNTD